MTYNEALDICYGKDRAFRERRSDNRQSEDEWKVTLVDMVTAYREMERGNGVNGTEADKTVFMRGYMRGMKRAAELLKERE